MLQAAQNYYYYYYYYYYYCYYRVCQNFPANFDAL